VDDECECGEETDDNEGGPGEHCHAELFGCEAGFEENYGEDDCRAKCEVAEDAEERVDESFDHFLLLNLVCRGLL